MNNKLLTCISAALLLAAGCSSSGKKYVIGVSQCSEDIWREKQNSELRMATYYHDNVELHFATAYDSDERQMRQIDSLVAMGVDLLIVSPNQMNTVTPAIDRAYDKGLPVILFDRKTASHKYTAFIGADNVQIGRVIGNYVANTLHGSGRVAEIMGLEGSSPAIERHRGFAEALARHPGIRLTESRNGTWMQESGREAMDSIMADGGDVDCVFAHNDRMALGACEAAAAAGKDAGSMRFVGIDALPGDDGGIKKVRDSVLQASYIYPTRGDLVMQLAVDILEGRPYDRDNYLQSALVTADNAGVLLMQEEEMMKFNDRLDTMHGKLDMYFTQYSHQKIYLVLCVIILLLCAVLFLLAYRAVLVRKRTAEEAAKAKLVFFTNVSHEFRTPLTLIADPVERILDDDNLTERQRHLLQTVRSNAGVMLRLVGEILDLRKIQNGKMTLDVSRFDLAAYLRRWTECFAPLAAGKDIRLTLDADGEMAVCADLYKVERICYNLLSNALKYTPRGGEVTVRAAAGGGLVEISVSDTGIGIPRDKVQNVFERFFRINNNAAGGTGIGLAIVKAFADMHGGRASVQSEEGRGTTFTVTLPAMQHGMETDGGGSGDFITSYTMSGDSIADTGEARNMARMTDAGGDGGGEARPAVLVVDDNSDVRDYVKSLLEDGYTVLTAADGKEGLATARNEVPDVIVCDVMMPVMDGIEMCRSIKADTATCHIPVMLLTARAVDSQRAEGYDCGADAYMTKPFNGKVLEARIRNLLDNRRLLRDVYTAGDMPQGEKPQGADEKFIADFRNVVMTRLADSDLNVETVAAEMGFSRVQLYRKVKALTGSTPVEIIRVTRLKRAERLLRTTDKTVSEISYSVGFSSPSYFAKCFKDYFKVLPTEIGGGGM